MIGIRATVAACVFGLTAGTALAQTTSSVPTNSQAAPSEPAPQLLGGVAAIVNDQVISISDVAQRARLLLITLGIPATEENMQQALPRALEELVDEHLQLQKAAEYELEVDDREVDASVRDMAAQNQSSVEDFVAALRAAGVNPETLRSQVRAEIAWGRIMNGLYGSRVRISQLQIDTMLERLKTNASEERFQLGEIFLYAPTEQDKQQILQGANVILEQLRQGARFQLAAQQYSNSPTAAVGGDLGWVAPAELDPEVQAVIKQVQPPALTQPIVVDDGVYIYAVRAKQEGFQGARDVELEQVFSPNADRAALNIMLLESASCDGLKDRAEAQGLSHAPLGRVPESALTDDIRSAIAGVPSGGSSGIVDTPAGPAILFVCDRGQAGLELPSRDQIEERLFGQQLTMLSQRDLRDMKREATIIRR